MVCCKTDNKPSTKPAIASNIGFFGGAFWLRVFNVNMAKVFWIVKKMTTLKNKSSIRGQNPNVLVY
jgi:hypothetical protein